MGNEKYHRTASCQNCYFKWVIKEFVKKVSCPECGEDELIEIEGDINED